MISNPFYILLILSSSFFAFFTVAFAVEILIKIFRIQRHRIRSSMRLLPFFSLLIDLLFSQYSIAHWINPLSCESCLQKLILEIFYPHLKMELMQNQISLVRHLGVGHDHGFFSTIFMIFAGASLLFALYKLVQAIFLVYSLHAVMRRASICRRLIVSGELTQMLLKNKINIYVSDEIQIPLTAYPNIIIIPLKTMDILSQQEFEAVIAHEWEHVKYKDPMTRLLYHLVAAFFWWVPTRFWIKKIEQEQELACDQNVLKYGVSADSMASALLKVAKQLKSHQTICYFTSPENSTLVRIQAILGISPKGQAYVPGLNFFGVCVGVCLLLTCMIWL